MSYFPPDYLMRVRQGKVPGHRIVNKYGRNGAVANGSFELIHTLSTTISLRTSAITVRIKAGGHANDDAAGIGAQEVTVWGITDAGIDDFEAIATNGAGASAATSKKFWRVYRARVTKGGAHISSNTAAVIIEDSGGAADMIQIAAGRGSSQYGGLAVPVNEKGYMLCSVVTIDSTQPADVVMITRDGITKTAAPYGPIITRFEWDGLAAPFHFDPDAPVPLNPLSDIWFEASGSGGAAKVTVDFEVLFTPL